MILRHSNMSACWRLLIVLSVCHLSISAEQVDVPSGSLLGQPLAPAATCQEVKSPLCRIERFSTIQPFNNSLQHRSLDEAISELHKYAYLFTKQPCSRRIQLFLCFLYAPVCVKDPQTQQIITERLMMPCRENCEDAKRACLPHLAKTHDSWPLDWDCDKFSRHEEDKLCVHDPGEPSQSQANGQQQATSNYSMLANSDSTIAGFDAASGSPDLLPPGDSAVEHLGTTTSATTITTTTLPSNESICGDLFDCKQRGDPKRGMKAECIDYKLVCNGVSECALEPGSLVGLDEMDCQNRCLAGQRYCDGRCIEFADLCNGRLDCISGEDEQDCSVFTKFIYIVQYMWSIICLTVLLFFIYAFIRFLLHIKSSEHMNESHSDDSIEKIYQTPTPPHPQLLLQQPPQPQPPSLQILDHKPLATSAQFLIDTADTPPIACSMATQQIDHPIYHEPAYSIGNKSLYSNPNKSVYSVATKSDYERLNDGYSAASSVYAFGGDHLYPYTIPTQPCLNDSREPPAPPPPTPMPALAHSTGSINKINESYTTVDNPHEFGLFDQFCS